MRELAPHEQEWIDELAALIDRGYVSPDPARRIRSGVFRGAILGLGSMVEAFSNDRRSPLRQLGYEAMQEHVVPLPYKAA